MFKFASLVPLKYPGFIRILVRLEFVPWQVASLRGSKCEAQSNVHATRGSFSQVSETI
jgi:hypothetical protein